MMSLIVGTILVAINQGPAIVAGELTRERAFQIFLTYLVPYTVSTVSSLATWHEITRAIHRERHPENKRSS